MSNRIKVKKTHELNQFSFYLSITSCKSWNYSIYEFRLWPKNWTTVLGLWILDTKKVWCLDFFGNRVSSIWVTTVISVEIFWYHFSKNSKNIYKSWQALFGSWAVVWLPLLLTCIFLPKEEHWTTSSCNCVDVKLWSLQINITKLLQNV